MPKKMDSNSAPTPPPANPVPTPPERIMPPLEPQRGFFSRHKTITFALVLLLLGAAGAGTYYYQSGIWDKSLTNQLTVTHRDKAADPTATWQTYSNSLFGFSLKSPDAIQPLNPTVSGAVTSSGVTYTTAQLTNATGPTFTIIKNWINPSVDLYDKTPIAKQATINGVAWYAFYTPAGGMPKCDSSLFQTLMPDGKNTLAVSYMDQNKCPGDKVNSTSSTYLQQILATFKFDNQATTQTQSTGTAQTYVAKNFTLTFQHPAGFDVKEDSSSILMAQSPYKVDELGMDNAFFKLTKYDATHSKASELAAYKKNIKNVQASTQTIDGLTFTTLTGDDWGRFGGDSAGKVKVVFFNKSWLEMIQMPQGNTQTFDPIAVGEQVLASFKFSK